jgi:hypothetical protein
MNTMFEYDDLERSVYTSTRNDTPMAVNCYVNVGWNYLVNAMPGNNIFTSWVKSFTTL